MHYDRHGQPMTTDDCLRAWKDASIRRVAKDNLPGGAYLSTIWLGLDHGYGDGPPLIFESMTFPDMDVCERYATEEEAIKGHAELLARLRAERTEPETP